MTSNRWRRQRLWYLFVFVFIHACLKPRKNNVLPMAAQGSGDNSALEPDDQLDSDDLSGASDPQPDLKRGPPIFITGKQDQSVSGLEIENSQGDCLVVSKSEDIIIENSVIGPCAGDGIKITNSKNILVKNVTILGTKKLGIEILDSQTVRVSHSTITGGQSSVYAVNSSGIIVEYNKFKNVQGPKPRGQFVQFNGVYGSGNLIKCNFGRNVLGESTPEDAINIYQSAGTADDPIQILSNRIYGGGPSMSGGGILLGDGKTGSAYQLAADNRLVDPGQYGIAIAGGHHQQLNSNQVVSQSMPFSNVGLYVMNYSSEPCKDIKVINNKVLWRDKDGNLNGSFDKKNCATVAGWQFNDFNAISLNATILVTKIPLACKQ